MSLLGYHLERRWCPSCQDSTQIPINPLLYPGEKDPMLCVVCTSFTLPLPEPKHDPPS